MRGLTATFLREKHQAGLDFGAYMRASPSHADAWRTVHDATTLNADQHALLASFTRQMHVLCLSGSWCGDCVQQGPLLARIAEASPAIDLRWLDRDEHDDLSSFVTINAGQRVPTVIFCAEDHEVVSVLGDRTLARYRAIAAKQLGTVCMLPSAPAEEDLQAQTLADWLSEFERVQLLLQLSPRLSALHGD